jgi:superfamily II DNA/RNA helicase
MENFDSFGLPEAIMHKLVHLNFTKPTPIQERAIPVALQGNDILASAQTGTGKTAAFGLPLISKIITDNNCNGIVITPTRELAVQVMKSLQDFLSKQSNIKTALLIGGEPIVKQFRQLKSNPRLVVGTPGRINDHLRRKSLKLDKTNFLVLDETDRMLDMGFTEQIEDIVQNIKEERQTLLFSATLPKNIKSIAAKYLNSPVYISVGKPSTPAIKVKQENISVIEGEKYQELTKQLNERDGSVIIFTKTKRGADKLALKLKKQDHSVDAIHGDLRHNKREKVIANFRNQRYRILVATDVAARGIDIPHIEHVINYDLPQKAEDYIHRIGRTGRAEAEGSAISFITKADKSKWYLIQKLVNPDEEIEKPRSGNGENNRKSRKKKFGARDGAKDNFRGKKRKFTKNFKDKKKVAA